MLTRPPSKLNLPNFLTCSRFVLALVFTFLLFFERGRWNGAALFIFVLASLTDYWDGVIAREKGEITSFGRLMDPLADKMLTLSAFVAFAVMNLVPIWAVGLVLFRDVAITVFRLRLPREAVAVGAISSGKNKTILQLAYILLVLLFLVFENSPFWNPAWTNNALQSIRIGMMAIVAVTLWSGARYIILNREKLR